MILKDYDRGLTLFLADIGLPATDYFYSDKDHTFVFKNQNRVSVLPTPLNGISNGLKTYSDTIASTSINDDIITYGRNYNNKNKQFTNYRISETEIVGFFSCGGFVLVTSDEIGNNKYYQFKRQEVRSVIIENRSIFVKLERIGLKGKKIYIYKIRTMYPYAKYLHKDLINEFGYNENGKAGSDFRITKIGKFLRKYYLDEVPQLINLLKGDVKFVGCRPVSLTFLENYPENVYNMRLRYKPGLISPAIADNARTVEEVIISEYKFLLKVSRAPLTIKFTVLIKAFINVVTGKIKSQ